MVRLFLALRAVVRRIVWVHLVGPVVVGCLVLATVGVVHVGSLIIPASFLVHIVHLLMNWREEWDMVFYNLLTDWAQPRN